LNFYIEKTPMKSASFLLLRKPLTVLAAALLSNAALAQTSASSVPEALATQAQALLQQMRDWRRDIHEHPELSGQERRTAALVTAHLRSLGLQVQTGVGGHGVVGVLKGAKPGRTVALRADMDALPVQEATGLPFASRATQMNMGSESPVAHACGHDGHTAMLMGAASLLAAQRANLQGEVRFIFQPAEEGLSDASQADKSWGAKAMVEAGVMKGVDAIYGLHILPNLPTGTLGWRSGPLLASGDTVRIEVSGKQTHGAMPWNGVDPIVASAQIVMGLQTVVSRQLNIGREPAVITIGKIQGGVRENIIPETVQMLGTLRTFDEDMRADAKRRITLTAESIASASGARAKVGFGPSAYAATVNPPAFAEASAQVLQKVPSAGVMVIPKIPASEDFSEFMHEAPGFFFVLGAMPKGKTAQTAAPNHSPQFDFDEDAMPVGTTALVALTLNALAR
jgi:amidohydrolase